MKLLKKYKIKMAYRYIYKKYRIKKLKTLSYIIKYK